MWSVQCSSEHKVHLRKRGGKNEEDQSGSVRGGNHAFNLAFATWLSENNHLPEYSFFHLPPSASFSRPDLQALTCAARNHSAHTKHIYRRNEQPS
jgi:hypothetical protein